MTERWQCIHVDTNGQPCWRRRARPKEVSDPANREYCWDHAPVHVNDRDPFCWSLPLPTVRPRDRWKVLASWCEDRCPLCGSRAAPNVLDHDHQTGRVRGWICRRCNVGEGQCGRPRSMFARWRACPAAAMLGLKLIYPSPLGYPAADPRRWTGPTFLPEHAPDAHRWPHALTCATDPRPDDIDYSPIHTLGELLERPGP